ncbi:MAG: guanylate kinase [Chloroflexi bacterium]|nr:guanylate kinase [Chloroflexota bacterium]
MTEVTPPSPLVIVLTGPSGVGKDVLINRMEEIGVPVERPATMTTRAPRAGEVEGVHHFFVDRQKFLDHVAAGELLEHAEVYGNLYGVPRASVRKALASGRHVVIRVDVQGAESLRSLLPDALFLSLEPETLDALRHHLECRASETDEQIERRLAIARDEIQRAGVFCHPVRNIEGDLDATVQTVIELIAGELARPGRLAITV